MNLPSLGLKKNMKCYNRYFINDFFYIEEYDHVRKIYNNGACVKGLIFNEFEVDYYKKLEKGHWIAISYQAK